MLVVNERNTEPAGAHPEVERPSSEIRLHNLHDAHGPRNGWSALSLQDVPGVGPGPTSCKTAHPVQRVLGQLPLPYCLMKSILAITCAVALTGCSSLPTCGTPEAQAHFKANPGGSCSAPWWTVLEGIQPQQQPNYPVYQPSTVQTAPAAWGPQAGEQYQTIMVNTPNGVVAKRCKVLNGQAVACF